MGDKGVPPRPCHVTSLPPPLPLPLVLTLPGVAYCQPSPSRPSRGGGSRTTRAITAEGVRPPRRGAGEGLGVPSHLLSLCAPLPAPLSLPRLPAIPCFQRCLPSDGAALGFTLAHTVKRSTAISLLPPLPLPPPLPPASCRRRRVRARTRRMRRTRTTTRRRSPKKRTRTSRAPTRRVPRREAPPRRPPLRARLKRPHQRRKVARHRVPLPALWDADSAVGS